MPPAPLAIHLSIGQVYASSIIKKPLLAFHGADGSQWNLKEIGYIFSIAIDEVRLPSRRFATSHPASLHNSRQPGAAFGIRTQRGCLMGAILGLIFVGLAILLILGFFAVNRWSSRARDREKSSGLRSSQQMGAANTDTRGTGIN